jgi:hypothetical protein
MGTRGAAAISWVVALTSVLTYVNQEVHASALVGTPITSVKVVEKRVSEEVAIGQAARGGSVAGSGSISGGVSSTIPSICM